MRADAHRAWIVPAHTPPGPCPAATDFGEEWVRCTTEVPGYSLGEKAGGGGPPHARNATKAVWLQSRRQGPPLLSST